MVVRTSRLLCVCFTCNRICRSCSLLRVLPYSSAPYLLDSTTESQYLAQLHDSLHYHEVCRICCDHPTRNPTRRTCLRWRCSHRARCRKMDWRRRRLDVHGQQYVFISAGYTDADYEKSLLVPLRKNYDFQSTWTLLNSSSTPTVHLDIRSMKVSQRSAIRYLNTMSTHPPPPMKLLVTAKE